MGGMRSLEGRNKPVIDDDPIGRNFRCVVAHRARDGLRGSLLAPPELRKPFGSRATQLWY